MFEDPQLFRQARTMLELSKREVADIVGEKQSSVADVEAGRKKLRPELAYKLWAAMWTLMGQKSQRFTKEQMEKHENLLDMMVCAHNGLALDISPAKLLAWFRGEGNELTSEERQKYNDYMAALPLPDSTVDETHQRSPLTFEQAQDMPLDDVMDIVLREAQSSFPYHLMLLSNGSIGPEDLAAWTKSQVKNDPRFKIASAKAWISHVEKQRDDLERELREARESREQMRDELLEAYRRLVTLEKELEERQPK